MSCMTTSSTSTDTSHSGFAGQPGDVDDGNVATPDLLQVLLDAEGLGPGSGAAAIQPPFTAQEPSATTGVGRSGQLLDQGARDAGLAGDAQSAWPPQASSTAPSYTRT